MKKTIFIAVTLFLISTAETTAVEFPISCPEPFYFNGQTCVPARQPSDRIGNYGKYIIYQPENSLSETPVMFGPDGKPLDEIEYRKEFFEKK